MILKINSLKWLVIIRNNYHHSKWNLKFWRNLEILSVIDNISHNQWAKDQKVTSKLKNIIITFKMWIFLKQMILQSYHWILIVKINSIKRVEHNYSQQLKSPFIKFNLTNCFLLGEVLSKFIIYPQIVKKNPAKIISLTEKAV